MGKLNKRIAIMPLFFAIALGFGCTTARSDGLIDCTAGHVYAQASKYDKALMSWAAMAYDDTPKERLRISIRCLKEGGIARDDAHVVAWYQNATVSERSNTEAMIHLALLYYNGYGVPRDIQKARDLLQRAQQLGDQRAKALLGVFPSK